MIPLTYRRPLFHPKYITDVACNDSFGVGIAKTYGRWYGGPRNVVLVVSAWWGGVTVTLDARGAHETIQ
jgi:hypothetical protein